MLLQQSALMNDTDVTDNDDPIETKIPHVNPFSLWYLYSF